jgi:hypothetical protein
MKRNLNWLNRGQQCSNSKSGCSESNIGQAMDRQPAKALLGADRFVRGQGTSSNSCVRRSCPTQPIKGLPDSSISSCPADRRLNIGNRASRPVACQAAPGDAQPHILRRTALTPHSERNETITFPRGRSDGRRNHRSSAAAHPHWRCRPADEARFPQKGRQHEDRWAGSDHPMGRDNAW